MADPPGVEDVIAVHGGYRPSPDTDRIHQHLSGRVAELERLALAHAKRALAVEERHDRLRALINEALQDGPFLTDRDGYSWCWFCGGEGAWKEDEVEHEADCVWQRIEAALIDGPEPCPRCGGRGQVCYPGDHISDCPDCGGQGALIDGEAAP